MTPYLSIIIPAHNEAARIQATLEQTREFLLSRARETNTNKRGSEIIVVENGSTDNTAELGREFQAKQSWPAVRLIRQAVGDKGRAVKAGMLAANGSYRYMADADLSTPVEQVSGFLWAVSEYGADIVIGNRAQPENQTLARSILSKGFSLAASVALDAPPYSDTQAGFKLFSAVAAEQLFSRLRVFGWAFDVEILLLAQRLHYRVVEIPIPWRREEGSHLKLTDPLRMLVDLARIRKAHSEITL